MRLRFKIPLITVIALIVLVVAGLVLLFQSHLLENWVNRFLAERLAGKYGLDVSIGEIDGSFVRGFMLSDVIVRLYRERDTLTLAYLPAINISYDFSNLWHRRWIIDSLTLLHPNVYLIRDADGRWVVPRIEGSGGVRTMPSWEVQYVAVSEGTLNVITAKDTVRVTDINVFSSAKAEEGTYTARLDSLRFRTDDKRLQVGYAAGSATLFKDKLALQNVIITTDSSRVGFSLARDPESDPEITADIDSAHVFLPEVTAFLGLNLMGVMDLKGSGYRQAGKFGGDLWLSGTFQNRAFDSLHTRFHIDDGVLSVDSIYGIAFRQCRIDGYGTIDFSSRPETYRLTATVDSFNFNQLIFDSYSSDLNGQLQLDGRGFTSRDFNLNLDMDLRESYFDIYHFHSASGQMTIGLNDLYISPGFQAMYYDNRFVAEGGMAYKGEVDITGHAYLDDLTRFTHQTFIDLPAGRAEAEFAFTGPSRDPHLKVDCRSDSIWLYSFYSADLAAGFNIRNFLTSMRGPMTLTCRRGDAWGFPYDSLYAQFTLDSNLLIIDSGYIANAFSRTTVAGVLDFLSYPQKLTLDSATIDLRGRTFVSDGPQVISIDSNGYMFDRIEFDADRGRIAFGGRVNYDSTLDVRWNMSNVSIAPWVRMLDDTLDVEGSLSSTGTLSNTIALPEFDLHARLDSLRYQSMALGDLETYLRYEDSMLSIDSGLFYSEQGRYTASGEFPINLTPGPGHHLFDEREQDITITASDKQLSLAAFLLESVEYVNGDFSAEVDISGTPKKPHLNGVASLRNGQIKLIDLRDRLEQVNIDVEMNDRLVKIPNARASVPHPKGRKQGTIDGRGTILIKGINSFLYAINVRGENVPINYELGDVTGVADAEVSVTGETPPIVKGTITIPALEYRESFEETGFSLLSALEGDKTWDLDLFVQFPAKFWVKNDDIDAEFSGDINILREAGVYNFLGTLDVIRGKYFFLDKTFTMTPGGQITYDNIVEPDPKLNVEISTRVRTPAGYTSFESEGNYSYELILNVSGTLNNPIITGAGDSPIPTESILPALLADYRPDLDATGGNPALADRITVGGMGILASEFSKLGTRSLGLETFEINPDVGRGFDPLGTRLTIGTYALPSLYVFGSSYVDVNRGQEVGLEYRLGRHYLFEGRRDEFNLYHVNLKFNWEY